MKRKFWIRAAAILLVAVTAGSWCSGLQPRQERTVTEYRLETDLSESIRIVQLTDLHGWKLGENNAGLIALEVDPVSE